MLNIQSLTKISLPMLLWKRCTQHMLSGMGWWGCFVAVKKHLCVEYILCFLLPSTFRYLAFRCLTPPHPPPPHSHTHMEIHMRTCEHAYTYTVAPMKVTRMHWWRSPGNDDLQKDVFFCSLMLNACVYSRFQIDKCNQWFGVKPTNCTPWGKQSYCKVKYLI